MLRQHVVALGTAAIVGTSTMSVAHAETLVLDRGHVDFLHLQQDKDQLKLNVKEDVTGVGVIREADEVVFKVNEKAWIEAKKFEKFSTNPVGANAAYLPQSQRQETLWPGWDAPLKNKKLPVDFNFLEVSGPGSIYIFKTDGTNGDGLLNVRPVLNGGQLKLETGSHLITQPAHSHVHWIFTEPGTYTMKVSAQQGQLISNQATYTWEVVESPLKPEAPSAPSTTQRPAEPDSPAPSQPTEKSGLSVGAIVGIVIAIIAALGGLIAAALNGGLLPRF
ncbi:choice-of-anchor M domain-containing protein [Corynebacterium sp. ES2794-CONJ1]|uniref:choice-of-anchor M domain-containing protein n=1 Tax=unclassified Corynebacterium TaxID=2624378 RepID=UPI00216766E4|nr:MULTISPECIES: choice-of-anchor M domain-containing protein [unclassified Corynebacterium]MCS4489974.1 choice-of-anchor M domain-containing protein [Corynebacterium sp. ES2775-CONJ]MCS4491663.1 choice-of-anchor M domain-containing protein [Corynebacterium sp. ES2715-CONJ3]MCS4531768.1 choice-of-anchor M domain-containing protein [Corynebacterium sp. ES2730-CONJ]MCU9519164.1 choice-of-anchor M domain-containing protein [Corynebacterium sp. ES2794-CONJ1]